MRVDVLGLSGERGGQPVFGPLSFSTRSGESLVVTGPNGAGKSTLLRVLAGLLPGTAGTVRLEGGDAWPAVAESCHFLGPTNAMKPALSVAENLRFWQVFLGEPLHVVEAALDAVGLGAIGHLPHAVLSTGQKRRAAIARLLVSFRPIWLLDEPTAGLDRAAEERFTQIMRGHLAAGGMIVAATHQPLGLEAAGLRLGSIGDG